MATTDPVLHALVDLVSAIQDGGASRSQAYQNALKVIREHTAPSGSNGPNGEDVALPRAVVRQVEAALSIQLANAMQPDRQRSYEALEALRTSLTQNGNDRSHATRSGS